jgi:hypothetical protein
VSRPVLLLLALCGCRDDAAQTADRFVEAYFVEISQERAMPLCTGLARDKLEQELRLVADVRGRGYLPEQAKKNVRFRRRDLRLEQDRGRVRYDIAVEGAGTVAQRSAFVLLRREREGWRVSNWEVTEARAPESR